MELAVVGVGDATVDEIDLINIRQATHLAMARAVRALATAANFALVDGNDAPALPCKCDVIVDGDARSVSIAAASIIAKVTRDRLMRALAEEHRPLAPTEQGLFDRKAPESAGGVTGRARITAAASPPSTTSCMGGILWTQRITL